MDERSDRMTQPRGVGQARQAQAGLLPKRLDRAVSWSDFRTAVRYDPANRMLLAVPAISAKRAEHPWLGAAVTVHTRMGDGSDPAERRRAQIVAIATALAQDALDAAAGTADEVRDAASDAARP